MFDNEALIDEPYQGARSAVDYPAGGDHSEKDLLLQTLDAENNTGAWPTKSKAMVLTAAVSGRYSSHPESRSSHGGIEECAIPFVSARDLRRVQ